MPDQRENAPVDTRERILSAASTELARRGFAGARMEAIGRLAGVRKQVIYYYFPSKAALAQAVLDRSNAQSADFWASFEESSTSAVLHEAIRRLTTSKEQLAHLIWEGQEYSNDDGLHIPISAERRADLRRIARLIEREQAAGDLDVTLDPQYLALLLVLMSVAPPAFPQLTQMLTGSSWDDPVFVTRWSDLTGRLLASLRVEN